MKIILLKREELFQAKDEYIYNEHFRYFYEYRHRELDHEYTLLSRSKNKFTKITELDTYIRQLKKAYAEIIHDHQNFAEFLDDFDKPVKAQYILLDPFFEMLRKYRFEFELFDSFSQQNYPGETLFHVDSSKHLNHVFVFQFKKFILNKIYNLEQEKAMAELEKPISDYEIIDMENSINFLKNLENFEEHGKKSFENLESLSIFFKEYKQLYDNLLEEHPEFTKYLASSESIDDKIVKDDLFKLFKKCKLVIDLISEFVITQVELKIFGFADPAELYDFYQLITNKKYQEWLLPRSYYEENFSHRNERQGLVENFQMNNNYYNTNPNCQYSTLNTYNRTSFLGNVPPVPPTTVTGFYVVPDYKSITYNSLVGAVPSCTGYRNIQSAYGEDAADCNQQYVRKSCS